MRRLFPVLLATVALACTDPVSDLGVNLLEAGTKPVAHTIAASDLRASSLVDITGSAPRVLVGAVDDPAAGSMSATAYIRFAGAFNQDSGSILESVELVLPRNYVYGDTTGSITIALHDIQDSWDPVGYRADTTLRIGPEFARYTFAGSDTSVTIVLPASWIDAHESALKSSSLGDSYHGLALQAVDNSAIAGFNSERTELQVTTDSGSEVTFEVGATFTGIQRWSEPSVKPGLVWFQDGVGPAVRFDMDLSAYAGQPVNGAYLTVRADTLATIDAPMHFVRPVLQRMQLIAVPADPEVAATLVGEASLNDGAYTFSGIEAALFFQTAVSGSLQFEYLELRAHVVDNSVSPVYLHDHTAGALAPSATLVVSP